MDKEKFKFIFKVGFFITFCIICYEVFLIAQDIDFEENKKASDIVIAFFQYASKKTLWALAVLISALVYIVAGAVAGLFNMFILSGLNDPVIAISLILVLFALVADLADLMLNAPSQQNDLPAQCGNFAYRFSLTKSAIFIFIGVAMKVKIKFVKFDFRH